jgi:hypothetical protein
LKETGKIDEKSDVHTSTIQLAITSVGKQTTRKKKKKKKKRKGGCEGGQEGT